MKYSPKLLHLAILAVSITYATGAEELAQSEAQLRAWVAALGADDYQGRQDAEAALRKTSAKAAMPLLKEAVRSKDPEIQARARRLLDVLGWALHPDFTDPATVLPDDTMFLVWVPQANASVASLEKSAFGTMLKDHTFASFWNEILHPREDGKVTYTQDAWLRLLKRWRTEFTGCWAWSMMVPLPEDDERAVALFSTSHPEPEKSLRLLRDAGDLEEAAEEDELVRGIHVRGYAKGKAGAVVKNLAVFAHRKALLKQVIDQAAHADIRPALSGTPWFQATRRALPEKPLVAFSVNLPSLLNALDEEERTLLRKMGLGEWCWSGAALHAQDGLLHERIAVRIEGERLGWSKALNFRQHEPHLASLCPQDAMAFVSIPLEGAANLESGLRLFEIFQNDDAMAALIRKAVKDARFAEAIAPMKGEVALWALPPRDREESLVPVLQGVMQSPGEAEAKGVAEALASLIRKASDMKELVVEKSVGERTIFVFDRKRLDEASVLQPAWTTVGTKFVFGTDEHALDDLLKCLATTPVAKGLDASDDFKHALATIPEAERGMLVYVNPQTVEHAYGAKAREVFAEGYPKLAKLLPSGNLMDKLPGTMASICGEDEGLRYHADGLPPIGLLTSYLLGVVMSLQVR